jgi:hypothetical protein
VVGLSPTIIKRRKGGREMKGKKISARIAGELLERLEAFDPKFHSRVIRWQNYRIGGNKPMPVVFKGPLGRTLSADAVYSVAIYYRRGQRARPEGDRPTLDHFEVRLYPQPDGVVQAVLCYAECGKDEEIFFRGDKPLEVVRFEGQEKKGVLFFAPLGGNTEVVVKKENLEILFSGPCVVQITTGSEELMPNGSRRIVVGNGSEGAMEIYDHRKNRWSPFAAVEHIRKTVGKRSFKFWNLRDFSGDRNQIGHILTDEGLREIAERR